MTPGAVPSATKSDKKDERRRIIIALLFLLMSFGCIFCSSQSALWLIDRSRIYASMLSPHRADYGSGPGILLAPLSGDIAAEANQDEEQLLLKQTPIAGGLGVVVLPNPPLPTPAPTVIALLPTPTPTLTPTVSAPSDPPPATVIVVGPTPTAAPPTPLTPNPISPTPLTPDPITVTPITPDPITVTPITPDPITPTPITPDPITPTPITPSPITPTPITPTSTPTATPTPTPTATPTPTPTATPLPPTVFFALASFSINENGVAATIDVNLSTTSATTVTVTYASSDGTATTGDDYTPANGILTFSPGVTGQTFSVPISDDFLDELDETVNLALSAPTNATLGAPNLAILTIVDDDASPTVQFSSGSYSVGEAAGLASITVNLSAASALTVTVNYASSDGTATSGDYTATSGTLTFSPGVTSQPFPVPILDDTLDELDETVNLTLSAPTNATLGAPGSAILTILDDDVAPTVQFSAPTYSVNENVGTASITVTLTPISALTVTVDYATSNGTAVAGADYLANNGALTFAPLQTSQTFNVIIIEDAGQEGAETLNLTLSNPVNATIGGTNPVPLTITANDAGNGPCTDELPSLAIEIGPPDCKYTYLEDNAVIVDLVAQGSPPINVDGNSDFDLVYYERESPTPPPFGVIAMDRITVEISPDNINWYTVFVWGDTTLDTNTNIGQAGYGGGGTEVDNTDIPMTVPPLYQSTGGGPITGIAIDVDNLNPALNALPLPPPPGSYQFVRLTGPPAGGTAEVDSIEVLP